MTSQRRCVKCVMPDTVTDFDRNGVCEFCSRDDGALVYKGEDKFREILERHKQESKRLGRKYDCLVRASGGKDSLAALWRLVKVYGINPLVFNYESAFTHEQAIANLREATRRLKVDVVVNRDDSVQKRYVRRAAQILSTRRPDSVPRLSHLLCAGCAEGMNYPAHRLARKHGVTLIVSGGCPFEVDLRKFHRYDDRRNRYIDLTNAPNKLRAAHVWDIARFPFLWNPFYYKFALWHLLLPTRPLAYLRDRFSKFEDAATHAYVKWDEQELLDLLSSELGWKKPEGRSSTKRFDCKIHLLLDAFRRKFMPLSEKEAEFSRMIRRNVLDRETALKRLEVELGEESATLSKDIAEVLTLADARQYIDPVTRTLNGA